MKKLMRRKTLKDKETIFVRKLKGTLTGDITKLALTPITDIICNIDKKIGSDLAALEHWTEQWDSWGTPYVVEELSTKFKVWVKDKSVKMDSLGNYYVYVAT